MKPPPSWSWDGPGATSAEIALHTRARTSLAGQSTTRRRETTSLHAATLRGDLSASTDPVVATGGQSTAAMSGVKHAANGAPRTDTVRPVLIAASAGIALGATSTLLAISRARRRLMPDRSRTADRCVQHLVPVAEPSRRRSLVRPAPVIAGRGPRRPRSQGLVRGAS